MRVFAESCFQMVSDRMVHMNTTSTVIELYNGLIFELWLFLLWAIYFPDGNFGTLNLSYSVTF